MNPLPAPPELLDLTGTVTVVTGASGGIGAGIARRVAAAGGMVVLHHRGNKAAVEELAAELSTPSVAVAADLTDPAGPRRVLDAAVDAFDRVDALVNNAGAQTLAPFAEVTDEAWDEILAVNVTAVHRMTVAFVGQCRQQGRQLGGGGAVVHIASIEGHDPNPDHGHYATSKAAVRMHARAAALEFGTDGIRVNVVSPGLIHRDGLEEAWPEGVSRWRSVAPLERLGQPEDVGDACVFLVSPLARWVTGAELVVDGGMLAHPRW